ncbi:MAG: DNA/RNA non-specific endonuclease [Clostridia bacterium]|nr:DNA/RNA non-specific endonuclease [Clostridia bacterium]
MKKHLPFICVFYLCLILCALLYYVYSDCKQEIALIKEEYEYKNSDAYDQGWTDGFVFAAETYEDEAAQIKALAVDRIPNFSTDKFPTSYGFLYSKLDKLSRPGPAYALLNQSILPSAPNSSIRSYTPVGFQTIKFNIVSSGGWLYNRTHLIGNLFGGADDAQNLITCTEYLNQVLMYPIESEIYTYLSAGLGSVRMAVIPSYDGDELLCRGLYIYAWSLSDESIRYSVFLPNVQPGIIIDYSDGSARISPLADL